MKENWGFPGMPPLYVDVLHRQPEGETGEKVIVKGHIPWWGKPIEGWSGEETIIFRRQKEGEMKIVDKPDHEYK